MSLPDSPEASPAIRDREPTKEQAIECTPSSTPQVVETIGYVGGLVTQAMTSSVVAASNSALQTAIALGDTMSGMGSHVAQSTAGVTVQTIHQAQQIAQQIPQGLGSALGWVRHSPVLRRLTHASRTDQWIGILDRVNLAQVETTVRALQHHYPDATVSDLAQRLMLQKAILVAGSGLASGLMPGSALVLLGIEATMVHSLAAELVYEIAAVYGLDLSSSDRQGEAVAILGLSLGGRWAIEAGLTLVSGVPIAGALINASGSAALMYVLGYGACRFYEAQLNGSELDRKLDILQGVLQAEGDGYGEEAIAQEVLMDWVLAHMILAGTPGQTWQQLLLELDTAPLSPAAIAAISIAIDHPPPLEDLLSQIDRPFLEPLLIRCQQIAQRDGSVTLEEQRILDLMSHALGNRPADVHATYPPTPKVSSSLGRILLNTFTHLLQIDPGLDAGEVGYLVDRTDRMTGEEFEQFLGLCFEAVGYQVRFTPASNDFGADLILTQAGETTVVQAKRYQGNVGSFAVQEVVAAIQYYGATQAMVVTNSHFTPSARELAQVNGVILWERSHLIRLILDAKRS